MAIWETLATVIVGGGIGVAGSVVGPYFTHKLSRDAEYAKVRREKVEELLKLIFDQELWLHTAVNVRIYKDPAQLGPQPIEAANAIAAVYFPEIDQAMEALHNASNAMNLWTMTARNRILSGEPPKTFNDLVVPQYSPFVDQRIVVVAELQKIARESRSPKRKKATPLPR